MGQPIQSEQFLITHRTFIAAVLVWTKGRWRVFFFFLNDMLSYSMKKKGAQDTKNLPTAQAVQGERKEINGQKANTQQNQQNNVQ